MTSVVDLLWWFFQTLLRSTSKDYKNEQNHDPFAKQSRMIMRSTLIIPQMGDGDIWVEKRFQSSKSGKERIFFCSTNTGRKVRDEPPTGASKIVYL